MVPLARLPGLSRRRLLAGFRPMASWPEWVHQSRLQRLSFGVEIAIYFLAYLALIERAGQEVTYD